MILDQSPMFSNFQYIYNNEIFKKHTGSRIKINTESWYMGLLNTHHKNETHGLRNKFEANWLRNKFELDRFKGREMGEKN